MTNDFALVTMLSLCTTNDSGCFHGYFSTAKIMTEAYNGEHVPCQRSLLSLRNMNLFIEP